MHDSLVNKESSGSRGKNRGQGTLTNSSRNDAMNVNRIQFLYDLRKTNYLPENVLKPRVHTGALTPRRCWHGKIIKPMVLVRLEQTFRWRFATSSVHMLTLTYANELFHAISGHSRLSLVNLRLQCIATSLTVKGGIFIVRLRKTKNVAHGLLFLGDLGFSSLPRFGWSLAPVSEKSY